MSGNMIEDIKNKIYKWGKQKILDTTNLKTNEEADEIIQKIWIYTIQMCSKPLNPVELESLAKQKISDWCAKKNNE